MIRIEAELQKGFTLVELLLVVSIVTVLMGILLPAMAKVRHQARAALGMSNQRQIVGAVSCYALDSDELYPESVATVGSGTDWGWQEPRMLTACRSRRPDLYRSMSAYLHSYIEKASILFCPNAPRKYKYLQQAWDAGDSWDNPETFWPKDPVSGTYCFYWNYTGYLEDMDFLFQGPRRPADGLGQSKLLLSCYFGYDHWRSRNAYGSCERFGGASITEGALLSSAYWSGKAGHTSPIPRVKLFAGYLDGRVESYSASDTLIMRVIWKPATGEVYPPGIGPGDFYLPRAALP